MAILSKDSLRWASLGFILLFLTPQVCFAGTQRNLLVVIQDALVHIGMAKSQGGNNPERWLGTGFFIDQECRVVTAKHLFRKADKQRIIIRIRLPHNRQTLKTVPARVIYEDPFRDIAFLEAVMPEGKPCHLGDIAPLSLAQPYNRLTLTGQMTIIAGFPRITKNSLDIPILRKGVVASGEITYKDHHALLLDMTSVPGFSGSPVVLERTGEVIGVVLGTGPIRHSANFELATPITRSDYDKIIRGTAADRP